MKRFLNFRTFGVWCLSALFCNVPLHANDPPLPQFHTSRVLVRFQEGTVASAKDAAHAAVQATVVKSYAIVSGLQLVQVPEGQVLNAVATYNNNSNVLSAQPDYVDHELQIIPSDVGFSRQWGMNNSGLTVTNCCGCFECSGSDADPGTPNADIDAPEAWSIWQGPADANDMVIAVIDGGIDVMHPDLRGEDVNGNGVLDAGEDIGYDGIANTDDPGEDNQVLDTNIWTNPGEIGLDNQVPPQNKASNGRDDDSNGCVDDVHGCNFLPLNDQPPGDANGIVSDGSDHGTRVAGVIAAIGNNGSGVAGTMWRAKLVPLKVCDTARVCYHSLEIAALEYCKRMNIPISNNSWGGGAYSELLYNAIRDTQSISPHGHLFITAAGNDGTNNDTTLFYPADYGWSHAQPAAPNDTVQALHHIIVVAATDNDDNLASLPNGGASNYGAQSVDIAAPGKNV